jgi:hypothetical protein
MQPNIPIMDQAEPGHGSREGWYPENVAIRNPVAMKNPVLFAQFNRTSVRAMWKCDTRHPKYCGNSCNQVTRIVGIVNGASVGADLAGEVAVGIELIGEGVGAGEERVREMLR